MKDYNFPLRKVLIAGGTGLVGEHAVDWLQAEGHEVRVLTTNKKLASEESNFYYWNVQEKEIDQSAFDGIEVIINLAGASIAGGIWTKKRRELIYSSRIDGTAFLFEEFEKTGQKLITYFGASAIGYYGPTNSPEGKEESDPPGKGFLAEVCVAWEKEHKKFEKVSEKTIVARFSNILAPNGGILKPYILLSNYGLKIKMSKSTHLTAWIHIEDIVRFISNTIYMDIDGTFNVVSSTANWAVFQNTIYRKFGDPIIDVTIPGALLKLLLGEMATLFTEGTYVANKRLDEFGIMQRHIDLDATMEELKWMSPFFKL